MKKPAITEKKILLFIDTGDNCRCPMAFGYLTKLLDAKNIKYIEIITAGVMTPTGLLPTPEAVQLLHEEHVDIRRHRSRPLTEDMIRRADLILGMTPFHVQRAIRQCEDARSKTFLLKEYVGREGRNTQIADPMGGTLEIFKKCFSEIKQSLNRLMDMDFATQPPVPRERTLVDTTPDAVRQQIATAAEAMKEARQKAKPKPVAKPEQSKAKPRPMAMTPPAPAAGKPAVKPTPKAMPKVSPAAATKPKPAAPVAAKPAAAAAAAVEKAKTAAKPAPAATAAKAVPAVKPVVAAKPTPAKPAVKSAVAVKAPAPAKAPAKPTASKPPAVKPVAPVKPAAVAKPAAPAKAKPKSK